MPRSHPRNESRAVALRRRPSHCRPNQAECSMDQINAIASAITGYFDLMYDADDKKFPDVFHDACLIHGMREGKLTTWSASEFRDVMRGRQSPAAMKSPREQAILNI